MIRHLAYAGLDFLITPEQDIYFLEVNPTAFGVYFIDIMIRHLKALGIDAEKYRLNENFTDRFVDMLIKYSIRKRGIFPSRVGLYFEHGTPEFLQDEYIFIKNLIEAKGYRCILFSEDKMTMIEDDVFVKLGDELEHLDLVINRGCRFPDNINLAVVNSPLTIKIAGNKLSSTSIIKKYIEMYGYHREGMRVPESYKVENFDDLARYSKILDMEGKGLVLKPSDRHGGEGILFGKNRYQICKKVSRKGRRWFMKYKPFILQEWIKIDPFTTDCGKRYAYDIRIYCLNGEMSGGFARRAPVPIDNMRSPFERRYISDVLRGGSLINIVMGCSAVETLYIGGLQIRSRDRLINIDDNAICLPENLLDKIRVYSELIIRELDKEIDKIVERSCLPGDR